MAESKESEGGEEVEVEVERERERGIVTARKVEKAFRRLILLLLIILGNGGGSVGWRR